MASSFRKTCATCARYGRDFAGRYREFLLDPGTLFTLASILLLVAATVRSPGGMFTSGSPEETGTILFVFSAVVGSVYIWWSAIQGIRERDFTADIPVSIATFAAIAIGQYSAAAIVAVLLLVGGMLEEFVAARAGRAVGDLASLLPDRATVRRDGRDIFVRLEDVEVGDILLVRSGERVAVDGEVVKGEASVSQAAVTGESMPVEKEAGDTVYAGTLNEVGALEILAKEVGEETTLGRIRRMVEEAKEKKAPIERVLDKYAKFYTPIALILGAALWWWTGDPLRAITMLIVFCPCVMVLATPTALVASIGNAALRGSLVKKGSTVEAMAKIDTIAFDKTGTLTFGEPEVVEVAALDGIPEGELLRLAGTAEKFSEHPVGRAIFRAAEEKGSVSDPDDFHTLPGMGVRATHGGREVLVGRSDLLSEHGIESNGAAYELASLSGRSVVSLAVDGKLAGLFVLEDKLRPEAKETIEELNALGLRTVLVSGDERRTAERVAERLGIEEVHAEVLPEQKVEVVERLQKEGRRVAFVGDGINDGLALAAADVGVAMGLSGTDFAVETAEVALLSDELDRLPHLASLSKKAMAAIKQNLVFSLGVLGVAVGLTIPGILTPVTGALLHELSSIPVIANSARLIRWNRSG
ncbi:MAG: cation-translocating P-type ATPase [Rubrobacter sp.]|nr:cation-translocating P-type ATPase [Rubrobacter sp.]